MRSTHYIKKFKYLDKTYKFKEPLKVIIDNFIGYDLKTTFGELYLPDIWDGYTGSEIKNPEKEIKKYLTYTFENFLAKPDSELDDGDRAYKERFLKLIDLTKTK